LDALARLTGCATRHYSRYPGRNFAPTSALRDAYRNAYAAVTGKTAGVNVIHAGLECGIIYSKKPGMDIISIGPDMQDIHSPKEKLDLSSVEVFWHTLVELIARWK
jgi:dipeptidase D